VESSFLRLRLRLRGVSDRRIGRSWQTAVIRPEAGSEGGGPIWSLPVSPMLLDELGRFVRESPPDAVGREQSAVLRHSGVCMNAENAGR